MKLEPQLAAIFSLISLDTTKMHQNSAKMHLTKNKTSCAAALTFTPQGGTINIRVEYVKNKLAKVRKSKKARLTLKT